MFRNSVCRTVIAAACLACARLASAGDAPPSRGDLLLFASAEAFQLDGTETLDDSLDGMLTADVVGSWTAGRFRALGELFLATDEQEFERLQVGWEVVPETLLWLGRFHQPSSRWNTLGHHGQYLQTSITRPAIENWEDDDGVLPQHSEGLLLESRVALENSRGLILSASAGVAPMLRDGVLEPDEIFDPRSGNRGASYSWQIAYLPDYAGTDGIGLMGAHSEIMLPDGDRPFGAGHIDLDLAGFFFEYTHEPWRAVSTTYWVRSAFDGGSAAPHADTFVSGYLQVQRRFGAKFTALGRIEASSGVEQSAYIALFEDFVEQRAVIDLRWDFARRQALTFEWADTDTLHDEYREYRLQWSAALR